MKAKNTKKTLIVIVAIIAVLVVGFLIYWKATEHDRYIENEKNDVLSSISNYRNGETSSVNFWIGSSALEDPSFIDFLAEQVSEMFNNGEYSLLSEFLEELEDEDIRESEILNVVTNSYESLDDLDIALEIKDELRFLDYYNSNLNLNRNSDIIACYIESNGTEEITTTPGTGYYANEEDSSSRHRVGISGSSLYDAESVTYQGDFKIKREYGRKLNSHYEETSYSREYYYFRGNSIDFSPDDGECIYSGDYLFCFSYNGSLIGFEDIIEK